MKTEREGRRLIGATYLYKNGKLKFGVGAGWVGYSVTIDIDEFNKFENKFKTKVGDFNPKTGLFE